MTRLWWKKAFSQPAFSSMASAGWSSEMARWNLPVGSSSNRLNWLNLTFQPRSLLVAYQAAGRTSPWSHDQSNGFQLGLIELFGFIVLARILRFEFTVKLTVFMADTMMGIEWWVFGLVLAGIMPNVMVMQGFTLISLRFIEGKIILALQLSVLRYWSECQVLWIFVWPTKSAEKLGQMMWNRIQLSKVFRPIFRNQVVSDIAKRHLSRTWL